MDETETGLDLALFYHLYRVSHGTCGRPPSKAIKWQQFSRAFRFPNQIIRHNNTTCLLLGRSHNQWPVARVSSIPLIIHWPLTSVYYIIPSTICSVCRSIYLWNIRSVITWSQQINYLWYALLTGHRYSGRERWISLSSAYNIVIMSSLVGLNETSSSTVVVVVGAILSMKS